MSLFFFFAKNKAKERVKMTRYNGKKHKKDKKG